MLAKQTNLYAFKQVDNVSALDIAIVFLVFFTSVGWVADSGTVIAKFIFFLALAALCFLKIKKCGLVRINKSVFVVMLPILIMIFIGLFVHNRAEDLLLIFKLLLALLLLMSMPVRKFWKAIPKFLFLLFPLIIAGYFLQIIGVYFSIPDFLLDPTKREYHITPVLTVVRGDQIYRAFGPFWEPGVLSFVANVSLISKLFVVDAQEKKRFWVEVVILAIAQSAGGLIVAFLIFGSLVVKNKAIQVSILICFLSMFALLLALDFETMRFYVASIGNIFTLNLLGRDLLSDSSFSDRIADLYVPFLLGLQSVVGFSGIDEFVWSSTFHRGQSAVIITNSFGFLAYFYGFSLMLLYLVVFSYSISRISEKGKVILIPIFILTYFSNPLPTVLFSVFIILSSAQAQSKSRVRLST